MLIILCRAEGPVIGTYEGASQAGDTLWEDPFPALDLIGHGMMNSEGRRMTDADQKAYIGEGVRVFFDGAQYTLAASYGVII